jgi:NAD-dependent histone deacetylase SIR2
VSPSKRRQAASHYSDLESSPSKKRDIAAATLAIQKLAIEDSERGLLFGVNSTNVKPKETEVDLGMSELVKAKPAARGRQVRVAKAKKATALETKNVVRKKTEFWVELEMVK